MATLEARGLSKDFDGTVALDGVDIDVDMGERVGLIGPNGSGKTTLVNVVTGNLKGSGKVTFDGEDITGRPTPELARKGLLRTFQIPRPFNDLTIYRNVLLPLTNIGEFDNPEERVVNVLEEIGLKDRADSKPTELNLIDLRRLELARTLVLEPDILFLDEVLAGLRRREWEELMEIIRELTMESGIVMIEHVMEAVMQFSERVVVLNEGKVLAKGQPEEIMRNEKVVNTYLGKE
ncbi:hypothetical protein AKJ40_01690 [candidate division MSBL1 archaeon SCGC-AAA259M10]|uniref:ABC transporter domain-containing protein n=1 Tax=candidate division MSBL1 archaeon SCGC-AAA259M10 TaxID=1698270 RepID=A0A133V171_9EURY|nr:hypothetical protein AKJ40_01690 [candidate division MSBL1 archaeon SCGC-AAA259M10]